jgi:hypothetical protein
MTYPELNEKLVLKGCTDIVFAIDDYADIGKPNDISISFYYQGKQNKSIGFGFTGISYDQLDREIYTALEKWDEYRLEQGEELIGGKPIEPAPSMFRGDLDKLYNKLMALGCSNIDISNKNEGLVVNYEYNGLKYTNIHGYADNLYNVVNTNIMTIKSLNGTKVAMGYTEFLNEIAKRKWQVGNVDSDLVSKVHRVEITAGNVSMTIRGSSFEEILAVLMPVEFEYFDMGIPIDVNELRERLSISKPNADHMLRPTNYAELIRQANDEMLKGHGVPKHYLQDEVNPWSQRITQEEMEQAKAHDRAGILEHARKLYLVANEDVCDDDDCKPVMVDAR